MKYDRNHPSPAYLKALAEAKEFHRTSKVYAGDRTFKAFPTLERLCRQHRPRTLLDYGCGKGLQFTSRNVLVSVFDEDQRRTAKIIPSLADGLCVNNITGYDPAVPEFDQLPAGRTFDGVYCVDVMNVIPEEDIPWVFAEMSSFATRFLLVKFRCNRSRVEKSQVVTPEDLEFWTEAFFANVSPDIHAVLRIRTADMQQLCCQRFPGGQPTIEPAN